jgi:SAM-dependent methyltransferase
MVRQADIFLESEGNAWFDRNKDRLGMRDPVSDAIEMVGIVPDNVLEVGCANGWRLARLRDKYRCKVLGLDPSMNAIREGMVPIFQGTAENLPRSTGERFDLIIYGFCLYLTEPSDWLRIAAEADMVLRPGGHIVIHDFSIRDNGHEAFGRPYEYRQGVMSYHVDFASFWLSHPLYSHTAWYKSGDEELVEIIRKGDDIPVRP